MNMNKKKNRKSRLNKIEIKMQFSKENYIRETSKLYVLTLYTANSSVSVTKDENIK